MPGSRPARLRATGQVGHSGLQELPAQKKNPKMKTVTSHQTLARLKQENVFNLWTQQVLSTLEQDSDSDEKGC